MCTSLGDFLARFFQWRFRLCDSLRFRWLLCRSRLGRGSTVEPQTCPPTRWAGCWIVWAPPQTRGSGLKSARTWWTDYRLVGPTGELSPATASPIWPPYISRSTTNSRTIGQPDCCNSRTTKSIGTKCSLRLFALWPLLAAPDREKKKEWRSMTALPQMTGFSGPLATCGNHTKFTCCLRY